MDDEKVTKSGGKKMKKINEWCGPYLVLDEKNWKKNKGHYTKSRLKVNQGWKTVMYLEFNMDYRVASVR